ncbi:MAG: ATP-binding protein, partial [Desulfosarcinaceae bacterium]
EVIEKNIGYLSSQIAQNGYIIKTRYGKELPLIMADSEMLYQAFLNIFINAMQAMPDGGEITVVIEPKEEDLWIIFEDEGSGIPTSVIEDIWDPFFTTKEQGTGLGLGIVKNIIEAHHGIIRIDNKTDAGTRVSIKLPRQQRR